MADFAETAGALVSKQTICRDVPEVDAEIERLFEPAARPRVVSFVNAHAVIRSQGDPHFRDRLMGAHRLYRDGSGMRMLMEYVGLEAGINMNGTDLVPKILDHCPPERRIALFGTRQCRADVVAHRLERVGRIPVLTADGFQPDAFYVDLVVRQRPNLIVLAMGMPKQERVAQLLAEHPSLEKHDMIVINGGAIIDFMSNEVPRAPRWLRSFGGEWIYRLVKEPKRMAPRLLDSIKFAFRTWIDRKALKREIETARKQKTNQFM